MKRIHEEEEDYELFPNWLLDAEAEGAGVCPLWSVQMAKCRHRGLLHRTGSFKVEAKEVCGAA